MSQQLANLLFPDVKQTIEDIRKQYPPRPTGQQVTRFAPSPTGFLHIGGVYTAYIAEKFVHQGGQNGICILRIEDTDQKREKEGAVDLIIESLKTFGLQFDEGPFGSSLSSMGSYGPYLQSQRKDIYHIFVKHAIEQGFAYPCWMSEEEIEGVRNMQQASKKIPGIYGQYSKRRDATFDQQQEMIAAGKSFVVRLKAPAGLGDKVTVTDLVRGEVQIQDNINDIVLLKSTDGLPTYHMAHLVDDYLMGTTHVIRSDERFASLPLHLQLFGLFGFQPPVYAHISPLLKLDPVTGNKRKLSKRHDPEADIQYFLRQGIPVDAILEFLTNIIDPFFEEWQKNNIDKTYRDYIFNLSRMNPAGALLDMKKLLFVSKERLARLGKEDFLQMTMSRVETYHASYVAANPDVCVGPACANNLLGLMKQYPEYTFNVLNIERLTDTDPKRYTCFSDVLQQLPMFYDEIWNEYQPNVSQLPPMCDSETMITFVKEYSRVLDLSQSKDMWFAQLKEIGSRHGFAPSNADFKNGGYKGKIGDLAMYLRVRLLGSPTTPDLYESMKVMGHARIVSRLQ